ncbi:hypothetical protein PoB_004835600 [Plakobranchus ocellatus]|uniref:LEM domain-containing protein n=1 Tax=Plakobranchus ocellatus TaxID=259542 RepID=A0AAV4BEV0_9GAST|nr:hypothetical protein PoB_004835600 [Plakobranchus ocellatus]
MADPSSLTDAELAEEFAKYGEVIPLPIKPNKRPILVKKLNHIRARSKTQEASPQKGRPKAKQNLRTALPPASVMKGSRSRASDRLSTGTAFLDEFASSGSTSHSFQSSPLRSRSNEVVNSDDSEIEPAPNVSHSRIMPRSRYSTSIGTNNEPKVSPPNSHAAATVPSARDRKREPQFADNILRTLRRRTGEPPPRRSRRSEVIEVAADSTGDISNRSFEGSEDEIAIPSPARSRLYPNLSRFTSFLSRSTDDQNKFESSDSDIDDTNAYEVENKSANTSFPVPSNHTVNPNASYSNQDRPRSDASDSSFGSFSNSPGTSSLRLRSRRQPSRVQPYKSWYLESLPQVLVFATALFFAGITITYIVTHKDFFMAWFSSTSNIGKLLWLYFNVSE